MLQIIIGCMASLGLMAGEYIDSETMGQLMSNVIEKEAKCRFAPL